MFRRAATRSGDSGVLAFIRASRDSCKFASVLRKDSKSVDVVQARPRCGQWCINIVCVLGKQHACYHNIPPGRGRVRHAANFSIPRRWRAQRQQVVISVPRRYRHAGMRLRTAVAILCVHVYGRSLWPPAGAAGQCGLSASKQQTHSVQQFSKLSRPLMKANLRGSCSKQNLVRCCVQAGQLTRLKFHTRWLQAILPPYNRATSEH